MRQSELKKLIKEAIADRIKMIDEAGDIAALEAKIKKVDEDIKDAMSVKAALTSMDGLKYYVSSEIIGDMMSDMEASIKELQTKKKDLEDQKKAMDKNAKGPKKSEKKELDEVKKINEGLSPEIMGPLTDLAKSMNISVGELIGQIAAAAGTVGGMGAAIGSAYKSYKKGLPKGDDKKKNSNLKEEEKITAKQQFASDLQDDEDFIKFKSDAIIREPNPYFYKPWYKKKKNDDGYNTLGTYGVPNASYNDPFINPEDFEDYDELDEARFKKGEDVGKPGKGFAKIAKSAAKKYGSKEAGQKVAGAILKKVVKKESAGGPLDFSSGKIKGKTPKEGETYLRNLKAGDKFSIGTLDYVVVKPTKGGANVSYADGTGNMDFKEDAIVKIK